MITLFTQKPITMWVLKLNISTMHAKGCFHSSKMILSSKMFAKKRKATLPFTILLRTERKKKKDKNRPDI